MKQQNSINELIQGINNLLSKSSGRFTTDEISLLQQIVDELKRLQGLSREKQGIQIVGIIINLMRLFVSDGDSLMNMIRDWFDK
ncbi:hypothetical protein DVR12_08580 [Chitinophaga silvatica]|uniref:Uncharacterized protein n=1 Tax=Chitinophaga silvatica TaxID=2282649 RepID=A0A3E1YCF1_9BACT|nr:hypothetical protein [Chitinophaga silvatica]RFS23929.1 hypothetical protein DVR12_08580 [Chitinophaga silvatica]